MNNERIFFNWIICRSANIIHCGKRRHADIPKFIPMDATSIYLDGNRLGSLTGDEFIGRKHLVSFGFGRQTWTEEARIPTKLRWLGRLGLSNRTISWLNHRLIDIYDLNLSSESESLRQNWLKLCWKSILNGHALLVLFCSPSLLLQISLGFI